MIRPLITIPVRYLRRALAMTAGCLLSLSILGGVSAAYNNLDNQCGIWAGGGYTYKWGTSINPAGNWAAAFVNAAWNWDSHYSQIWNYYSSSSQAKYDWYYNQYDGWAGKTMLNCGYGIPDGTIDDFVAYGNLYWENDNGYTTWKYNTAGHEIGHTYGFGHSTATDSIMRVQLYLGSWPTADDSAGIAAMYH